MTPCKANFDFGLTSRNRQETTDKREQKNSLALGADKKSRLPVLVAVACAAIADIKTFGQNFQTSSTNDPILEGQVLLLAADFRCACSGCGELFLIDCTCDTPEGALKGKSFICHQLLKASNP